MADRIPKLTGQWPVVNQEGIASKELRLWSIAITDRALILGSGSPEGVVEARIGAEYANVDGTTGSIKYFKKLDNISTDKSQGWVLI
jgi:hypothetical protein